MPLWTSFFFHCHRFWLLLLLLFLLLSCFPLRWSLETLLAIFSDYFVKPPSTIQNNGKFWLTIPIMSIIYVYCLDGTLSAPSTDSSSQHAIGEHGKSIPGISPKTETYHGGVNMGVHNFVCCFFIFGKPDVCVSKHTRCIHIYIYIVLYVTIPDEDKTNDVLGTGVRRRCFQLLHHYCPTV